MVNDDLPFDEWIEAAIAESASVRMPCILCHETADGRGYCVATGDFAKKLGMSSGDTRVTVYPICSDCQSKSGWEVAVESELLRYASAARN